MVTSARELGDGPKGMVAAGPPLEATAACIAALGGDGFDAALLSLLFGSIRFGCGGVMDLRPDRPPRQRLHRIAVGLRQLRPDAYLDGAYRLDPMHRLYVEGAPSGVYHLVEVAPEGFACSDYHQRFFALTGVSDELQFLVRGDDDSATAVFLERRRGQPPFEAADVAAARAMWPLVAALVEAQRRARARPPLGDDDRLTHAKLRGTLERFGRSRLSPREHEVLRLMIQGYATPAIAERLGLSPGTVKNHRKAIHRKLEVSSQAGLLALVLGALPHVVPDGSDDPLEALARAPVAR
jgi:DNA-binding CsgD family transcriptional regulator